MLRDLADVHFPEAEKIVLVCDNPLNTHHPSVPCEVFPPAEARCIASAEELQGKRKVAW